MKKTLFGIVLIILIPGTGLLAQDVQARLDEAKSAYQAGNLENARFSLQEALNEINQVIGHEILDLLPSELGGMTIVETGDNVTGSTAGFAGLYINREYSGENREASVEIVSDSPLLAGINSLLAMPAFMGSDQNQKRIKVDNYRGLLTKDSDEQGMVSYDIQIPHNNLLLTFHCSGIPDEDEVIGMAGSLPVDGIVKLAQ